VRFETSLEKMATLPTPFKPDGVVTAGNSSQISDGAGALVIASRERADEIGLRPRARFHAFGLAGVDPITMLTGNVSATKRALSNAGLTLEDIDAVEINEAFASVVLAWKDDLEIPDDWFEDRVNPNGGAVALGHPLGASGARLMTTLLHELERRDGRYGLQTMCEGGGMSNATVIERL
jgi:acetyl-CoA acetyltransferase family protein